MAFERDVIEKRNTRKWRKTTPPPHQHHKTHPTPSPGWIWHIYRQGSTKYFGAVLNFKNLYFFSTEQSCCNIFVDLFNKCCILKCFIFSTAFLGSRFIRHVLSVNTVLLCYNFLLNLRKMNRIIIFRVLLSRKYVFGGFCQWQSTFCVVQKYPTPLIPSIGMPSPPPGPTP